jgi:hypothetical protein
VSPRYRQINIAPPLWFEISWITIKFSKTFAMRADVLASFISHPRFHEGSLVKHLHGNTSRKIRIGLARTPQPLRQLDRRFGSPGTA